MPSLVGFVNLVRCVAEENLEFAQQIDSRLVSIGLAEHLVSWTTRLSDILATIPTNSAFIEEITVALHSLSAISRICRSNDRYQKSLESLDIPNWYLSMIDESSNQGSRLDQLSLFALVNVLEVCCFCCSRDRRRDATTDNILRS